MLVPTYGKEEDINLNQLELRIGGNRVINDQLLKRDFLQNLKSVVFSWYYKITQNFVMVYLMVNTSPVKFIECIFVVKL